MVKLYSENNTKIFNPETGRYVKVTGTIGRRLQRMSDEQYNNLAGAAGAGAGLADVNEGGVKKFSGDKKKILNPKSNKFVSVTGTLGRKLLKMNNEEYSALGAGAGADAGAGAPKKRVKPAPKRQVKPKPDVDLKKVIREEQAKAIVRGVKKADEYMRRFQEQVAELFNELPEQVVDEIIAIPPTHNIRDIARMIIRPPTLQREQTDEGPAAIPTLERERTVPEMVRTYTGETIPYVPRSRSSSLDTIDLELISNVSENIDALVKNLEDEFDVGVEESKIEDVIVDNIRNQRRDRLNEIINNAKEGELNTEEQWDEVFKELYELEPVKDDDKTFTGAWEEFADELEKIFDEMLVEEKEKEKEKDKEKEQKMKQINDMLNDYYREGDTFDNEVWQDFADALNEIRPLEQDSDEYKALWETAMEAYKKNTKTSPSQDERMKKLELMMKDYETDRHKFDNEDWKDFGIALEDIEPVEQDTDEYKALWETAADIYKKNTKSRDELTRLLGYADEDDDTDEDTDEDEDEQIPEALEAFFNNLQLNPGRGAYMSTSHVPDPHVSAFEHIEKHK